MRYKTCENHQVGPSPRFSPSASLVKISAISPTNVPFNPFAQSSPTGATGPFFLSLSFSLFLLSLRLRLSLARFLLFCNLSSFSLSSSTFSLVLLLAMLCFAEDRICQIPEKRVEAEGESVLSGGHPAAKGPRGLRQKQLFSGAMTFAALLQHARSNGNGNSNAGAAACKVPQKPQKGEPQWARALTSQFTREVYSWIFPCSFALSLFFFLSSFHSLHFLYFRNLREYFKRTAQCNVFFMFL